MDDAEKKKDDADVKKKSSDKEEADKDKEEEEKKVDIDRQKLIQEIKELLAPCSRELITSGKIVCCIWFDEDDDGNSCLWIARIEETQFDEAEDVTSMLCKFPGYNLETYWLPIIFKTKWLVFQPNEEILLKPKYKGLWHAGNFEASKDLLNQSREYLSDISEDDDEYEEIVKKKPAKKKKKRTYKKKKDRIKTKRKRATSSSSSSSSSRANTTKYAAGDKRIQSLDDVDTTTMRFIPVSKKHLVAKPDLSNPEIDHQLIEIMFSFDTTGSMSSCLATVKTNLKKILDLLFRDIPKIRISILAHGDYGDERSSYVMRWVDLTDDKDKLVKFVDNAHATGGGGTCFCFGCIYVYVLYVYMIYKMRLNAMNWSYIMHRDRYHGVINV